MEIPPLNVSVTKAAMNGQIIDVIDYNEYSKNPEVYGNRTDIGIPTKDKDGVEFLLPTRGEYKEGPLLPGYYDAGPIDFVVYPEGGFKQRYIPKDYVRMSNIDDIATLIRNSEAINKLDEPFITSPDEITCIPIRDSDQPEMKALKMALNAKHMDLDKYASRFGPNYPNDKRQLKGNNATLKIIKRFAKNCDMDVIITFKDKNDKVLNPIGSEISISLTDGFTDCDELSECDIEDTDTAIDEEEDIYEESSDYSDD